jgi:acyl-CoA reductase-like NAD-dependent aldehyde dehydrogenase
MKLINPANETVLEEINEDNERSILEKFNKVKEAQKLWSKRSIIDRLKWVLIYKQLIKDNIEELVQTLTEEMGKPLDQSRGEILGSLGRLDYFYNKSEQYLAEELVNDSETHTEKIVHEPLGVVVNISAWNFPYNIGFNVFIPALIAGNGVLYKPSEFTTRTGIKMIDLLYRSGVPEDVIQVVIGNGAVGGALLELPAKGYFFTGSYNTGKLIYKKVASKMVPCQLELGGKDPLYVSADNKDIDKVAGAALEGAFYNNGQSCCAVERIYVHEALYDDFVRLFLEKAREMKVGDPTENGVFIGPLARHGQIMVLEQQVSDALEKGAKLLLGGKEIDRKGYYFEPTIIVDADHSMQIMKEESFGPIIGIQKVASDEEAISLMLDTEFGLTASVYSDNLETAEPIMEQMDSGTVYWNCCDRVSPYTPWSGRKHSGIGSTLSYIGIRAFTQPKAFHFRK